MGWLKKPERLVVVPVLLVAHLRIDVLAELSFMGKLLVLYLPVRVCGKSGASAC